MSKDSKILDELARNQQECLEELQSKYKGMTEEELYELSKEYNVEDVTEEEREIVNKAGSLTDTIEENLDSLCIIFDDYVNSYTLLDDKTIRDLEDVRTLTFLANDMMKNLFERTRLGE